MTELIDAIREKVMENVIKRCGSKPGDNLDKTDMNVMVFKDVFYRTLMDLELQETKSELDTRVNEIKEKYGRMVTGLLD